MDPVVLHFDQVHIDVARNATDDFNPFHDPVRWQNIRGNPFGATIALGFQMAFLAADRVQRQRRAEQGDKLNNELSLPYANFEWLFAVALRPGEDFQVDVRKTIDKRDTGGGLSNRVVIRKHDGHMALMGSLSDTAEPRFSVDMHIDDEPSLECLADRSRVPGTDYFLKRKYLNTSNGKNFAVGALCDQHDYFDELNDRVAFPPLFTSALLSCALLEQARANGHDFEADPLVYTSHQISVDKRIQTRLRSNDCLHMLVDGPHPTAPARGLGGSTIEQQSFSCLGLVHHREILFRARLLLAPLNAMNVAG